MGDDDDADADDAPSPSGGRLRRERTPPRDARAVAEVQRRRGSPTAPPPPLERSVGTPTSGASVSGTRI